MTSALSFLPFLFIFSVAHSAPLKLDYRPEVTMSAKELLSLPGGNRVEVAKKRGAEFVAELERLAFSAQEDYGLRWKALILSAQIQGMRAEKTLQRALKAPEWFMRNAALLAYQDILPLKATPFALDLLKDKALVVRSAAVQVLAKNPTSSIRESLWEELGNAHNFRRKQSLFIRHQILAALARDPADKELPLFVQHLRENDSKLHASAISALEKLTSQRFGQKNDSLEKKRVLWMKWAKNTPEAK